MDTEILVDNRIEDGQRLIEQLSRDEFEVLVAFWLKTSEQGAWHLCIASPSVDVDKPVEAYRTVYASLNRIGSSWVLPSDLSVINGATPAAQAAIQVRDRYPGRVPTRYRGKRLGDIAIEEAYIYPRATPWFKGFDTIRQNFPNAEAFTIPVLFDETHAAKFDAFMGKVNAMPLEGHAPTTVMFMGVQNRRGKPLAELGFVYRPEGWNTLYRPDTQRYEEVRYAGTNEPLYPAVDFGPLAALRTQKKPGEDQVEMIKATMDKGGYYITLPPDATPIHKIPYTPPPTATIGPIDWEALRAHIQNGGRVDLHRNAT